MSAQFVTAVAASLTTAGIMLLLRQVIKARQELNRLLKEHRFLMRSMARVLKHLNLELPPDHSLGD